MFLLNNLAKERSKHLKLQLSLLNDFYRKKNVLSVKKKKSTDAVLKEKRGGRIKKDFFFFEWAKNQ